MIAKELFNKKRQTERVDTPTMLQVEAAECGVVALSMVLGYHGRWLGTEHLRISCAVGRDGSNAANIIKAARAEGLIAKGFRSEDTNFERFGYPCILHWNFNHFVCLEGRSAKGFAINDPAQGKREVTEEELNKAFTGVVLSFKKGPDFEPLGTAPYWLTSLKTYLGEVKGLLSLVFFLGITLVLPGALLPLISKIFIDDILVNQYDDWLWPLLIGLAGVGLVQALLTYFQSQIMLTLQTRLSVSLNSRFIQRAFELPLKFFAQRSAGEMASRPQLIDRVAQLIAGPLGMALIGWLTALTYFVIMLFYDVPLSLCILLIGTVNVAFFLWQAKQFESLNQIIVRESATYQGSTMQSLQLLPEIKASGAENMLFTQLVGQKAKWMNQMNRLTVRQSLLESLPSLLTIFSLALLLMIGGQRVIDGAMSLGVFVAFQGLMQQFMAPLQQMLGLFSELQETQGNLDRLEDITRHEERDTINWKVSDEDIKTIRPHLVIKDLTFGYQPFSAPLLDKFSLEVKPGTWTALVGSSGSGKSTLARLVAGLHKPWEGSIFFGGEEISNLDNRTLRSSLAVVDQQIVLFNASVRDNLSLWNTRIDEDSLIQAAKSAQIHDWIIHRPGGYDHKLSENGTNISGGEKARIEIARALASKPSFIILDEATAALDSILEAKVLGEIKAKVQSGIIISHRIAAIRECEEIIVFDGGKPVQRGSHQELIEQEGVYRQLIAEEET